MLNRIFIAEGHLIDSGILAAILNQIVAEGADYEIIDFVIGKTNVNTSRLEIEVFCSNSQMLDSLTEKLVRIGCFERGTPKALLKEAPCDRCVPDEFYSTTNHRTEVFTDGEWREVKNQRMDGVIVPERNTDLT